jgi:hypothetical protein
MERLFGLAKLYVGGSLASAVPFRFQPPQIQSQRGFQEMNDHAPIRFQNEEVIFARFN